MLKLTNITRTFNGKAVRDLFHYKTYKYNSRGSLLIKGFIQEPNGNWKEYEWFIDGSVLPGRDKSNKLIAGDIALTKPKNMSQTQQLSLF